MRKRVASSYMYTDGIYCVLLLTNRSNKEKIISVSHVTSECVLQYRDLFTTETKERYFFHLLGR